MHLPIAIIIPTLNEEKSLPRLLTSITRQTLLPKEVIVADAFSTDNTRKIARSFGCTVVNGGMPGKGRNLGAKKATQPYFLFLDADVVLPPSFLEKTFNEFFEKKLDIASCYVKPLSKEKEIILGGKIINSYWNLMKDISPKACGFCIFAKAAIHKKINGFDESIYIGEDADYIQNANKAGGKFDFLLSQKIPVSIRRFSEEGTFKTVCKYVALELYQILVGKVKKPIFNYQFGNHREM